MSNDSNFDNFESKIVEIANELENNEDTTTDVELEFFSVTNALVSILFRQKAFILLMLFCFMNRNDFLFLIKL